MTEALRWLIVAEILSIAFLPLTAWAFAALPDRGLPFSKIVGLLVVVWLSWWIGVPTKSGGSVLVIVLVLLGTSAAAWLFLGKRTIQTVRNSLGAAVTAELVFIAAFAAWTVLRSFHPDIALTEKPMDLMYLQTASHVSVSPPQDLWLAGHGVNYYYFGYLLMAGLGKLAGTSVLVSYNLALSFIFAAAVGGSYSILFNLTRSRIWAGLGPLLVVLSGNAYAFFTQVLHGQLPWTQFSWFFQSSRVVGAGTIISTSPLTRGDTTINEFPVFSLVLGDLHPHVMAIPIALASISCGLAIVAGTEQGIQRILRLGVFGVVTGSLFAINAWDLPTYLGLTVAAICLSAWTVRDPTPRWAAKAVCHSLGTAGVALVAFLPFYVEYRSPTAGIGLVTTVSEPGQFLQVFGPAIFLCSVLLAGFGWHGGAFATMLHRARAATDRPKPDGHWTWIATVALFAVAIFFLVTQRWVLLFDLVGLGFALWLTLKRRPTSKWESRYSDDFVLLVIALGFAVLAVTETLYLRDAFAGSAFYRMNTVFKFYYQAWILLGIGGAFACWRVIRFAREPVVIGAGSRPESLYSAGLGLSRGRRAGWFAVAGLVIAPGMVYAILGPISYFGDQTGSPSIAFRSQQLDGIGWMLSSDPYDGSAPMGALKGEYEALNWLRTHVSGTPTVLEATGGEYSFFGRVSTYTGLPTVLGWEGHEQQWRGNDPELGAAHDLVDRIYSTSSVGTAKSLLIAHHISLVYVGACERQVYADGPPLCSESSPPSPTPVPSARDALTKFASFMSVIHAHDGVTIYRLR